MLYPQEYNARLAPSPHCEGVYWRKRQCRFFIELLKIDLFVDSKGLSLHDQVPQHIYILYILSCLYNLLLALSKKKIQTNQKPMQYSNCKQINLGHWYA